MILGTRAASDPPLLLDSSKQQEEVEEDVPGEYIILYVFATSSVLDYVFSLAQPTDPEADELELLQQEQESLEDSIPSTPSSRPVTPIATQDPQCSHSTKREQVTARKRGR